MARPMAGGAYGYYQPGGPLGAYGYARPVLPATACQGSGAVAAQGAAPDMSRQPAASVTSSMQRL